MDQKPRASALASRFRLLIASVGVISGALSMANLFGRAVSDRMTTCAAIGVGVMAAAMFIYAVFDVRLQTAVTAMNADRRAKARKLGLAARLVGWGLPVGDRLLLVVGLPLMLLAVASANLFHRPGPAGLSFAAFFLICVTNVALMARDYPADKYFGPLGQLPNNKARRGN